MSAATSRPSTGSRPGDTAATGSPRPEAEVRGQGVEAEPGVGVTSYLLAGPLTFGGIGYGLDRWLGTTWAVAVGVLIGMALSLYVIWLRYGDGAGTRTSSTPGTVLPRSEDPPVRAANATNATNEEIQ